MGIIGDSHERFIYWIKHTVLWVLRTVVELQKTKEKF